MYQQRVGLRAEYLQEEQARVRAARTLAEHFPELKTLTAGLACFGPDGQKCYSDLKCTFNLGYAKALFLVACPNPECIYGNFDLSPELVRAIAAHREIVSGEMRCKGWKSKTAVGNTHCEHLLRYTLTLGY